MNIIERDIEKILATVDLSPLSGKSVLVTGGSGLLGTYIVETIQKCGWAIDLHVQVRSGLHAIRPEVGTTLHYVNLASESDCKALPSVDVVISAASYAQPLRFLAEPLLALRSASFGLLALLEKCSVGGRFLFISSSEVYCDCPTPPPYKETDIGAVSPYHPRACYITGKQFGEAITYLYRQRGLSTVAVRPGITYGPGFKQGDQRSWASFIERSVRDGKLTLMDAGNVKRTLMYISDGIAMLFTILLHGTQPVYNLAGRDTLSIAEMAEKITRLSSASLEIPSEDHGVAGTPEYLALDPSRAETEFGRREYMNIDEGFERAIKWYRDFYGS